MERTDKQQIMGRLRRTGLWDVADSHRELVRQQRRDAGEDRETATTAAWADMWAIYEPVVERLEAEQSADPGPVEPQLAGLPVDLDSVLDPDYRETDRGRQLRDGLLWAALEWMRVVKDTIDGPVVNLDAASTPPPNSWALLVLSTYALGGLDKRRELITRAMVFAAKGPIKAPEPEDDEEDGEVDDYLSRL